MIFPKNIVINNVDIYWQFLLNFLISQRIYHPTQMTTHYSPLFYSRLCLAKQWRNISSLTSPLGMRLRKSSFTVEWQFKSLSKYSHPLFNMPLWLQIRVFPSLAQTGFTGEDSGPCTSNKRSLNQWCLLQLVFVHFWSFHHFSFIWQSFNFFAALISSTTFCLSSCDIYANICSYIGGVDMVN